MRGRVNFGKPGPAAQRAEALHQLEEKINSLTLRGNAVSGRMGTEMAAVGFDKMTEPEKGQVHRGHHAHGIHPGAERLLKALPGSTAEANQSMTRSST